VRRPRCDRQEQALRGGKSVRVSWCKASSVTLRGSRAPRSKSTIVPEFLREGAAIGEFKRPDRIVIGTEDKRAEAVMREIYRPLYLNQAPFLFTGRRTAELTKYAATAS
jgi:UDP-glucose 6-dehydrogenase